MCAKSVSDIISYSQGHELILVLEKAGLTSQVAQSIINSRGNEKAKTMLAALNIEQIDDRFDLVNTFDVTVPEGYDHNTCLDMFGKEHRKDFCYYNEAITDENYAARATTKLTAGRKFKVKVFQITERVSSEDCMAFLRSQKAVLVGAQGASLAYEQKKKELPINRSVVCFLR